jgi:hypothetical protein
MLALNPGTVLTLERGIVLHSLPGQNWFHAFSVVTGDQFRLNRTSFWVLEKIGDGIEWTRLRDAYLAAFEVSADMGEVDLQQLLEELHRQKIVRRQDNGDKEEDKL